MPLLAVLLAAVALAACAGGDAPTALTGTPSAAVPAQMAPDDGRASFAIVWAGDTLLADAAQPDLDAQGYEWPFADVRPLLEADYAIVNAEGPITTLDEPWDPDQRWSYNAQPEAAAALAAVGVDSVGLSNNHALDRGPEGLADTIAHLEAAGVRAFGAGLNADQALAPLLIDTPVGRVGVVGLSNYWGADRRAGEGQAGTVALDVLSIRRGYEMARAAGAEWVVAFVHWGRNYAGVDDEQRTMAAQLVAAGYDLVIGHGAHVQQPVELFGTVPIVYSLGNFVFGTPGRYDEEYPGFGVVAVTPLEADGFHSLVLHCIQTDNDVVAFQPRPCTAEQAEQVLGGMHPDIEVAGSSGVLGW